MNMFSRLHVLDEIIEYTVAFTPRKIALFHNVWVDTNAYIVDRSTCKAVRQGTCLPRRKVFSPPSGAATYPLVITLANSWGGTFHFPMEDMMGLALIDQVRIILCMCSCVKLYNYLCVI